MARARGLEITSVYEEKVSERAGTTVFRDEAAAASERERTLVEVGAERVRGEVVDGAPFFLLESSTLFRTGESSSRRSRPTAPRTSGASPRADAGTSLILR